MCARVRRVHVGLDVRGAGGLMTEADVETAVKRAEELWQKALDMRQTSDELSSQVFLPLPTPSRSVSLPNHILNPES